MDSAYVEALLSKRIAFAKQLREHLETSNSVCSADSRAVLHNLGRHVYALGLHSTVRFKIDAILLGASLATFLSCFENYCITADIILEVVR